MCYFLTGLRYNGNFLFAKFAKKINSLSDVCDFDFKNSDFILPDNIISVVVEQSEIKINTLQAGKKSKLKN
jgi:hypothetical protein